MAFLNYDIISMTISTLHLGFDSIFIRASTPLVAFSLIGLGCVYCGKCSSTRASFDLAMISGFIFVALGVSIRVDAHPYYGYSYSGYLLSVFSTSVLCACAFGLSLVCLRWRPDDWKSQQIRTGLIYVLMIFSLVLIILQAVILFQAN